MPDPSQIPELHKLCVICGQRYPTAFMVCPIHSTPLEDALTSGEDPMLNSVLGDCYKIVRLIGEGGTARVYEAVHTRLPNKRFAVKWLHARCAVQGEILSRFEREADTASRIHHHNVLDVYDIGKAKARPYFVSEYLEGEDLGDLLDRVGKLDAKAAVGIILQVCDGLAAAHAVGVIHRDMKPENIFLVGNEPNWTAKVLDFGISKLDDPAGPKITRAGFVMGTPGYMSPEQAQGAEIDARTDVYSVGVILYRALTGHKPFERDDAVEIIRAVVRETAPAPSSLDPSIPAELEQIIVRAMAKDREERYPDIQGLAAALTAFEVRAATPDTEVAPPPTAPIERPEFAPRSKPAPGRPRTEIALFSLLGAAWLSWGTAETVRAILRRADIGLDARQIDLALGSGIAATGVLLATWAVVVARRIRGSRRMADELAQTHRRVVGTGLGTLGVAAMTSQGLAAYAPNWDAAMPLGAATLAFATSVLVALVGLVLLILQRRRQRPSPRAND